MQQIFQCLKATVVNGLQCCKLTCIKQDCKQVLLPTAQSYSYINVYYALYNNVYKKLNM